MLPLLAAVAMLTDQPTPLQPVPAPRQIAWQGMGQYAFIHFGPNAFTDKEWGEGIEDPNLFNPSALDCRQWVKSIKDGGLTGVIITAKHHDGFCLWPSKYSTHTVAQSPFRNGKGDVLKELSTACKEAGLKFGVYLSPWDRNHPTYGTPEYNQTFAHMLREVLTQYGPIFEVWFDGANGEGPNGKKQVYDWNLFINTVRECQPNAVIFSDAGPDIRWVGNESGHSAPTCWSTIDRDRYIPGTPLYRELTEGKPGGTHWVPAECDVSIRPGWFYHSAEDSKVKTPEQLLSLWEQSVGQNGNMLLNIPPDRRGLIHENDAAALKGFRALRDRIYGNPLPRPNQFSASTYRSGSFGPTSLFDGDNDSYWAAPDGVKGATIDMRYDTPVTFDRVELREPIALGQRVKRFDIQVWQDGSWRTISSQTTIGNRRIVPVTATTSDRVRIRIVSALACPAISTVSLYNSSR